MLVQMVLFPPLTHELQILWLQVIMKNETYNMKNVTYDTKKWYLYIYLNLKLAHVTLKNHMMKVVTMRTTTMKF